MSHYRYLPFILTLNSPAIITIPGGDPNSSSTLSYIPGTAVRGASALALGDPHGDNSRQQEFHDLVLGGTVRYLNAYPIVDGRRALPTPVSLRLKKDDPENTKDVTDLSAFDLESWPDKELIPIGKEFLTIGAARPALYNPKISSRIHHQRDRERGRAWKGMDGKTHGAIFTFEFLEPDQMFGGFIQLCSEQEEEFDQIERRVKGLLGETLLLGRSRRSGYGGVASIEWGVKQNHETVRGGKEGLRPLNQNIGEGEQFRLLLTSQCIVRNSLTGQPDPAALMDRIVSRFTNRVEVLRKVWSFEVVGGFNRKWRLELPQTLTVSAGSVFVLKANQAISLDDLHEIEHEGFGERKTEGYGRLLFLDLDEQLKTISLQQFTESPSGSTVGSHPPEMVTKIESRIVQAQLARRLEEKAAELAKSARNRPKNSLIGRLRTPLREVPDKAIHTLNLWLSDNESEQLRRPAMDQLERCKIDGKNMRSWILEAMKREVILNWLNVVVEAQRFYVVSEQTVLDGVEVKSKELSVRLIDAVLANFAIRNKNQEVNDGH